MRTNQIGLPLIFFFFVFVALCESSATNKLNTLGNTSTITATDNYGITSTQLRASETPSFSSTPSPFPTFNPHEPYLILKKHFGTGSLLLLNGSGTGRKEIQLPRGVYIPDLSHAISPDGKWLAFHTSSSDYPYDLTLNLLSIPEGNIFPISKLLSEGYPENLSAVSDFYQQAGYDPLAWETLKWMVFDRAIYAFDWSPNSQSLAFTGQLDGPSSDLYIFDLHNNKITRKTDDLRILSGISWSPDGMWLVLHNAIPGLNNIGKTLHLINANTQTIESSPILEEGFWWKGEGWLTEKDYLISGSPDGGDLYGLRILNVEKGIMTDVWPGTYFSYAVDPENQVIAISGASNLPSEGSPEGLGTYLVTFQGEKSQISEDIFWSLFYINDNNTRFLGTDGEQIVTISRIGNISPFAEDTEEAILNILKSPDKQWFILYEEEHGRATMTLYAADGHPVRIFPDIKVTGAVWKHDSSGIIVTTGSELFSISIPDGQLIKIDQCNNEEEYCWYSSRNLIWIQ